ncbi:MAG TPA: copper resistance protein CopC [Alphaproteobacteria bacterium]
MNWGIILYAILYAAICLGFAPGGAWAHAGLVETRPDDGAILEHAPGEVILRFNEPVTPIVVRVFGPDGLEVALPARPTVVDRDLRQPLPADLPAGGYLVSWRVVSSDTHPIGGSFGFAVGTAPPAQVRGGEPSGREAWWQSAAMINRFVGDLALMLVAGGIMCLVFVLGSTPPPNLRLGHWFLASGTVAILSAVLAVGLAGGWLLNGHASAILDGATWAMGASTPVAWRALATSIGLLAAGIGLFLRSRTAGAVVAVAGAVIAVAAVAISGHVAAQEPAWLSQPVLMFHAVAAAFWIGSLPLLLVVVRRENAATAARVLRHFSGLALPAVIVLAAAGICVAVVQIGTIEALVGTKYGRILLLKLGFVLLLLALAARNRLAYTPMLAREHAAAAHGLRRTIRAEIGFASVILLLTAILAHTSPETPAAGTHHHHGAPADGYIAEIAGRDLTLRIRIMPAAIGTNEMTIELTDAAGGPVRALEARAEFSLPAAGIEPLVRSLTETGTGTYKVDAVSLPRAGLWHLRVEILISDFDKRTFEFELPVH